MSFVFRISWSTGGAILLSTCLACGTDSSTSQPASSTVEAGASKKQVSPADLLRDRVDQAVEVDGIRVAVTAAVFGTVPVETAGGAIEQSSVELLQIELSIEKLSGEDPLHYLGWGTKFFHSPMPMKLTDDLGQTYHPMEVGAIGVAGQHRQRVTLSAGKQESERLVFQPPSDKAEFLILALPMEAFGKEGQIELVMRNPLHKAE